MFATGHGGHTALFVAGHHEDRIRITDEGELFQRRRVVLDSSLTPGVVVYPL